jgi:hypothetical protein
VNLFLSEPLERIALPADHHNDNYQSDFWISIQWTILRPAYPSVADIMLRHAERFISQIRAGNAAV